MGDQYDRAQIRRQSILDLLHRHPEGLSAPEIAQAIGGNRHTVGNVCRDMRDMSEVSVLPNRKIVAVVRSTESAYVRREKYRAAMDAYYHRQASAGERAGAPSGPGRIVHLCSDKPVKSVRDGCRRDVWARGFASLERG